MRRPQHMRGHDLVGGIEVEQRDADGKYGDGHANPFNGEDCDDGQNGNNDDGCTDACKAPACGDMIVQMGETCDDGKNGDQDDGCTDKCKTPVCGDAYVQATLM